MSRDVVRYLLAILVPIRLLLTIPAVSSGVAERLAGCVPIHVRCAPHPARSSLMAGFSSRTPVAGIALEAREFSEDEKDLDFTTAQDVSMFDDPTSWPHRPEPRRDDGIRRPSRAYPLRC